jgi:hypothetical protein
MQLTNHTLELVSILCIYIYTLLFWMNYIHIHFITIYIAIQLKVVGTCYVVWKQIKVPKIRLKHARLSRCTYIYIVLGRI